MEIYGEKVEPIMASSFSDMIQDAIDDLWGCMDNEESIIPE